jgi:RNA polymerase sigma-70 factor (ECF subfamily)
MMDGSAAEASVTQPTPAAAPRAASSDTRDRDFASAALPHLSALGRVAIALTGNEADADDLVQETFLRAYRAWHTFAPGSDCRKWLSTICRNAFLEHRRRESKSTAVEDQELESLAAARLHNQARTSGVDHMFTRLDLGPAISSAIGRLEPIFRDVVVLVDVEGFSYEEVAEALSVPVGTVRSRLYRARRQLQEALLEYAIDAGFATARAAESTPAANPEG